MRRLWCIVVAAWLFPLGVRANLSGVPLLSEAFAPRGAAIVETPQAYRPGAELPSATPLITAPDPADRLAPFIPDEWSDICGPIGLGVARDYRSRTVRLGAGAGKPDSHARHSRIETHHWLLAASGRWGFGRWRRLKLRSYKDLRDF